MRHLAWPLASVLGLVLLGAAPVSAQTAEEDSVRGRPRPEFVPLGLELDRLAGAAGVVDSGAVADKSSPLASYVVFPKLELAAGYETNLFRDSSRQADRIVVVSPSLAVRSDWNNHALELSFGADVGRHDRNPSENYEDLRGAATGVVDVTEDFQLRGQADVARLHLQRGGLLAVGRTSEAIEFHQSGIALGAQYNADRLMIRPQFKVVSQDYKPAGGIDNDDLDRVVTELSSRFAYEWLPGTALFVEPSYNDRSYDLARESGGLLQDSHGSQILVGFTWDVSGVTFLEFGTGYLRHEFDEPRFGTIQGPALSGRMVWNPLDSITLDMKLARTVEESRGVGLTGKLVTSVRSRLDYELLYNVILSAMFDYANEEDRTSKLADHRYLVATEARYLVGPNWFAGLVVGYDKLTSAQDGLGFSNGRVTLRLGAQL